MSWEEKVKGHKARLNDAIPQEWRIKQPYDDLSVMSYPKSSGILTDKELEITESLAVDLVKKLVSGQLTAVEVTTAFCKRAALAQQLVNCVHEFFPDVALERAKELDDYFAKHGKPVGPLHGLPISLKDQFRIKGLETNMGYVAWIGNKDDESSVLVSLLYNAGAVFYVKTSVPQSLMFGETLNNIVGRTVNPRNKLLSCGGSSGGEGALLAFRGSVIGLGTDIGGSVRIPAAFNFLYGLRPSHGRLPYAKMANSMEGQETIHSVCGPLGHSVADMRLLVTSALAQQPWLYDSKVIPMPWRQSEEDAIKTKIASGGLTLAFYLSDGQVQPHPPIARAIDTVVNAAKTAGHTVVPWTPFNIEYASQLLGMIYGSDAGKDIFTVLEASGEPTVPNLLHFINPDAPRADIKAAWDFQLKKWEYQCDYLAQIRKVEEELGREIDAIISPVAPHAAIRHDQYKYYGYSMLQNLLDFTSVVVPVLFVDKEVDAKNGDFRALSELDDEVQNEYDPEVYHGAPTAVQITGRRLTEERVLAIAEEIGRLLGNQVAS